MLQCLFDSSIWEQIIDMIAYKARLF